MTINSRTFCFKKYVCEYQHVCMCTVCMQVPVEVSGPLVQEFSSLWAVIRVLRIKPRSSTRVISAVATEPSLQLGQVASCHALYTHAVCHFKIWPLSLPSWYLCPSSVTFKLFLSRWGIFLSLESWLASADKGVHAGSKLCPQGLSFILILLDPATSPGELPKRTLPHGTSIPVSPQPTAIP